MIEPPTAEQGRMATHEDRVQWRKWGPYVSDRQWGTVREDYSATGEAWDYFPFDIAHKRVYRWGEDGIFGISDVNQHLCFALAMWNENDDRSKSASSGSRARKAITARTSRNTISTSTTCRRTRTCAHSTNTLTRHSPTKT